MGSYEMGMFKGHGQGDSGAVGNGYQEHERVSKLVDKVCALLTPKGLKIHIGINNYLNVFVKSNTYSRHFAFSFHLNSSVDPSAIGSEIIVPMKEKEFTMEVEILKGLEDLGFSNRGLKSRDYNSESWYQRTNGQALGMTDYYGEIREAWNRGVSLSIIEFAFISNANDIKRFNDNMDKIALIVANAILRYCDMPTISAPKPPTPNPPAGDIMYRVMCGSFKDRSNAEKRIAELKTKGYEATIMIYEK